MPVFFENSQQPICGFSGILSPGPELFLKSAATASIFFSNSPDRSRTFLIIFGPRPGLFKEIVPDTGAMKMGNAAPPRITLGIYVEGCKERQFSPRFLKYAQIEPHIMPLTDPQTRSFGIFFQDPSSARLACDRAAKRVYMSGIFRPFEKIRLIWACFKTEANTGSDWIRKIGIRA